MTDTPDLYAALGVAKKARPATIQKAYRKAALAHHPDRGGDRERFERVHLAYEVLADPDRRKEYDATGKVGPDPKVDNTNSTVVEVIGPLLPSIVAQMAQQRANVTEHDLVKHLREAVGQMAQKMKAELRTTEQVAAGLKEAAARFEQDGEVNLLRAVAEAHLKQAEAQAEHLRRGLVALDQTTAYLKKSKYRHKARQTQYASTGMMWTASTA